MTFEQELISLCNHHMAEEGVGNIAAHLQNTAAAYVGQCDDAAFRRTAVKNYRYKVEQQAKLSKATRFVDTKK